MQDGPDKLAVRLWLLWQNQPKTASSQPSIIAQLAITVLVSFDIASRKKSMGAQEKTATHLQRPSSQIYLIGRSFASNPT